MTKQVYLFNEGSIDMKSLLGGKGANLAEMTRMGLPVPEGFTITTVACNNYLTAQQFSADLKNQIEENLATLEKEVGKKLNDVENPLLVSVRSGAVFSMPGMMDTILNLGLNDQTVEGLAKLTNDERFAYDCYRRLLQMFGDVVFGVDKDLFEQQLSHMKEQHDYQSDTELTAADLKNLVTIYKSIYQEQLKRDFPQDPKEQLYLAIEAVFKSWMNPRAKVYRSHHHIAEDLGTAVNIQMMVFGNSGDNSGTGVAFTRNPSTGEKDLFGEFLLNAQGEDVVAGIRTPVPIRELAEQMPDVYQQFKTIAEKLEQHHKDMQDIEFTIENGKLFFLQTRNGKRTPKATLKVAVDLVKEGLIDQQEALLRVEPELINQLLHPVFDEEAVKKAKLLGQGLPASPGAASGKIYFEAANAKVAHDQGEKVILVRQETSPEDIEGMIVSEAIVTSRGGMTSHAAVVARGMGTCCVAGCQALQVQEYLKQIHVADMTLAEGDVISVDGSTGKIYLGEIPALSGEKNADLDVLLGWADEVATMKVMANADSAKDLQQALEFGAKGIGLTRTEHMFFEGPRLLEMRKLILADSVAGRMAPLKELLKMQVHDFTAIYALTQEKPVTIRLLDPPLHEFLPKAAEDIAQVASEMQVSAEKIAARAEDLHEVNPMLGHRGCRLAVTYPEIYEMQVEAIMMSALDLQKQGITIKPEIMIPLIGTHAELKWVKQKLVAKIESFLAENQAKISYKIGTMIEIPRACLTADKIAEDADFFSFGTNDLTQLTFGFSRDDAVKFIGEYVEKGLLKGDPFQTLDVDGVGQLIQMATERGRQTKPDLKVGVCGEVGGDPVSVHFFQKVGLTYVSCSPFRIPLARLAAAQAKIMADNAQFENVNRSL